MCASSVQMKNLSVFSSSCPVLGEPKDTEPKLKVLSTRPSSLLSPALLMHRRFQFTADSLKVYWMCLLCPSFPNFKSGTLAQATRDSSFMHTPVLQLPGYVAVVVPSLLVQGYRTVSTHRQLNVNCSMSPFLPFLSLPFPPSVFSRVNVCLNFCLPGLFCVPHNAVASHHITQSKTLGSDRL